MFRQSNLKTAWKSIGAGALAVLLVGCGDESSDSSRTMLESQNVSGESFTIVPVSSYLAAYNRSAEDANVLNPVNRSIALSEYEQLVEPELNGNKSQVNTFITGLGLEATIETQNAAGENVQLQLPVRLGLVARQWDRQKRSFGSATRIFSTQGANLAGAQSFAFGSDADPRIVIAGMGLRLREANLSKLELRRQSLSDLMNEYPSGSPMSALNRVELPVGWAVVGVIVSIDQLTLAGSTPNRLPVRKPFFEDLLFYLGALQKN